MSDELLAQIRVLQSRVVELEASLETGTDPLLKALGERVREFLHVVTPDGRMLATGRPSEGFGSVIGRSVFDFIDPASADAVRDAYARACATRKPVAYESVAFGEDGSPQHTYLSRVFPVERDNEVQALIVVPTDITERVRLERSLVEKEETLRLAIAASRMGLWRWDIATGEVTWDDRLREVFGVHEAPGSYQQYLALVHPDDRALVDEAVRDAIATGVYRTFEHRVAAAPGVPERWLLAAGSVVKDANGLPLRLMGGALDITEQKHFATQHLRAERVESIGQLTAGIAHNFNNLLAVIVPSVEMALSSASDRQRVLLSATLDASLQARDLVRNLMTLTQRDDTRSMTAADVHEVVTRVEGMCRVTFPREISLRLEVAGDVGHVAMRVGDLEQVLLNLLLNARDALDHPSTKVREIAIHARRSIGPTGVAIAEIRVIDSGRGMTEEVRARVFEPFFTTKPPHQGSGLGLSNVAVRVREAGGSIRCESSPGVGTTFIMLVPLQTAQRDEAVSRDAPAASTSSATMLLVDDEPLVRNVVRSLLEYEGYAVLEAGSAEQARQILCTAGTQVDLVILDQSMPRETGIEAVPSLRALTRAPIVLFTGMAPELPAGIDAVLEKPARPAELHQLVRSMLGKRT